MPGYAIVTLSLKPIGAPPGDATAEQMDAIADLADRYSFGEIRVGHEQNLVLPHVRAARPAGALAARSKRIGARDAECRARLRHHRLPGPRLLQPRQCALDPGGAGADAAASAISRWRTTIGDLHIKISGCINACGHHHVGHIGILGVEKNGEEFYQITLGGRADEHAELGTLLGPAVPYDEVADVVEDMVAAYLELRERPGRTLHRHRQARRRRAVQGACLCHSLRAGRIVDDRFRARRSTTRRCRTAARCIVPAARFLADAEAIDAARRRRSA